VRRTGAGHGKTPPAAAGGVSRCRAALRPRFRAMGRGRGPGRGRPCGVTEVRPSPPRSPCRLRRRCVHHTSSPKDSSMSSVNDRRQGRRPLGKDTVSRWLGPPLADTTRPRRLLPAGSRAARRRCALGSVRWGVDGTRSPTPLWRRGRSPIPAGRPLSATSAALPSHELGRRWDGPHQRPSARARTNLKRSLARPALGGDRIGRASASEWSCRESNPGPAVPALGALRA
jgi:hypothetical protein